MGLNILIGDASPRVRFGLRFLLEQQPGWRVVGEAEDVQALLESARCGCPDLVLLVWELPGIPAQGLLEGTLGELPVDSAAICTSAPLSKDGMLTLFLPVYIPAGITRLYCRLNGVDDEVARITISP